jgi:hypothetical protein
LNLATAALEDQAVRIQAELRELRSRRNSLTRICRLPEEILVNIFKLFRNMLSSSKNADNVWYNTSVITVNMKWTRVTFVCRHLQGVALAECSLWDHIKWGWPEEFILSCLQRARDYPLTLLAMHDSSFLAMGQDLMRFLFKHAPSARSIELIDVRNKRILQQPLPRLHWLKINFHETIYLDKRFLGGACDALAVLEICAVTMDARNHLPEFPSLRELHVDFLYPDEGGIQSFYKIFENTPVLETISIGSVFLSNNEDGDVSHEPHMPISLPFLRKTYLDSDVDFTLACLRTLPSPSHQLSVRLPYTYEIEEPKQTAVFNHLSEYWKRKTGEEYLPFGRINCRHIGLVEVQMGAHDQASDRPTVFFCSMASINLEYSYWSHVETLNLDGTKNSTEILVHSVMRLLTRLRSIVIHSFSPTAEDKQNLRTWFSSQSLSARPIVQDITFIDRVGENGWEDVFEELKDSALGIRIHWRES